MAMRKTAAVLATAAMMALSGTALAETTVIDLGGPGGDLMRGTARSDVMKGLGGNDAIHGKGGNDTLYGNSGHDALYGGAGDDTVRGGGGDDRSEERAVYGGSGDDTLRGDAGDDALYGGPGVDEIRAGDGNDLVGSEGDGEADTVDCGAGTDVVKKSPTEQLDSFVNCEGFVS